jgi:hypothetical protein
MQLSEALLVGTSKVSEGIICFAAEHDLYASLLKSLQPGRKGNVIPRR